MSSLTLVEEKYEAKYSDVRFWNKVQKVCKWAGVKVIYPALLLNYALQEKDVPLWAKTTIIGALGYFISSLDAIPDLIPIAGYIDDLSVLTTAVTIMGDHINWGVKQMATDKLQNWFGEFDEKELLDA
ncbi:YkvA family protein [Robertkochia sediminum]|uniref:YkvA family protein n=1 Tax=Robertkochia sediminum TaxID=2785326 RepID=UPI001933CB58|nr:YkvA family protein [Robertkochia sediminum]MBL7472050.1 DUF1232 domain-containing protein [Robertkochia sediminum]